MKKAIFAEWAEQVPVRTIHANFGMNILKMGSERATR